MTHRAAGTKNADARIEELEKELSKTKYNKRTQHHVGLVKAKIAALRDKEKKKTAGKGKTYGYSVRKTGDATVILIGFPSVGKSTLLNALTNKESEVGAYDFTTLTVVPGLLVYQGAQIQILDVPGIVRGAASGQGRGKEVLSVMRNANMAVLIIDATQPRNFITLVKEVRLAGLRLNEHPPDVKISKTGKNGIQVGTTCRLTKITKETIKDMLKEFRILNAEVIVRENITDDQLIDSIEANKVYMPAVTVLNKADLVSKGEANELMARYGADIAISAEKRENIDQLKELIFNRLGFIRIFLKEPSKPADLEEPLIMFDGCTVHDVGQKLHKDFINKFKFSRVWGKSAKFPGQKFSIRHALKDGDILEVHLN